MINDVKRAYFHARVTRDLYVELPEEDRLPNEGDLVGKLELCLYGTRDAALNWQETVADHLESLGFTRGRSNPCVFHHPSRGILTLVHGDDYASAGDGKQLRWLQVELEKKFDLKTVVVGLEQGDQQEAKILNRVIRVTQEGWELEADPRHAELLVEQMGLEMGKAIATPGVDGGEPEQDDEMALGTHEVREYRGLAARGNYLGADRPDIQFAVKEACREMSNPTKGSLKKMKRVGRYLINRPRLVWKYAWQPPVALIEVFADANFAGCKVTRKSTSGGALMLGSHLIKTWSKTQACVTLSSAESELLGAVKAGVEGLGMQSLLQDLGTETRMCIHMDASAALGVIQRKGVGKVRHLDVGTLWLQEKQLKQIMEFKKIHGLSNAGDMMTKNVPRQTMEKHVAAISCEWRSGRASIAAQLHSVEGD